VKDTTTPTDSEKLHTEVLSLIDPSGRATTALHNAVYAAAEDGHHIESADDRATDIDAHLDRAMRAVDTTDPDPDEVYQCVEDAANAAHAFRIGLDSTLKSYEPPEHVDMGVYETLGEYAKHVEQMVIGIRERADRWCEVA